MWPFSKKKKDETSEDEEARKLTSHIDRLIMGVIIGGAIGSVLGMTLAPKKGKETRKYLREKGMKALDFMREVREEVKKSLAEEEKPKGLFKKLFGGPKRK